MIVEMTDCVTMLGALVPKREMRRGQQGWAPAPRVTGMPRETVQGNRGPLFVVGRPLVRVEEVRVVS